MDMQAMEAEIKYDEGVRYAPYLDSRGFQTIGVGHNMDAGPLPSWWTFPLTDDQVNTLLTADLQSALNDLDDFIPWWAALDDVRQRAMLNLCFNLGWSKFREFAQFQSFVKAGAYAAAGQDLGNTPWFKEVGERGPRIVAMIETGFSPYPESIYLGANQ